MQCIIPIGCPNHFRWVIAFSIAYTLRLFAQPYFLHKSMCYNHRMNNRHYVNVRCQASGEVLLTAARWGATFFARLRGLMFRRRLAPGEALILVEGCDSRLGTIIHMWFMFFPIAAVWVNSAGRVVDKVLARPWWPAYAPRAPARYVLETAPDFLEKVEIGDELVFEDTNSGS